MMKRALFFLTGLLLAGSAGAEEFAGDKLILKGGAKIEDGVLRLNGKSAYALLRGTEKYNIAREGLTLACSVRLLDDKTRTNDGDPAGFDMFFSKGDTAFVFGRYLEKIYTNIKNAANKNRFGCATRTLRIPSAGVWTHMAATFQYYDHHEQGETGYLVTVYLNGDRVARVRHKGLLPVVNDSPLDVGKGWGSVWMLNGDVAEIFAERRALNDAEIAALVEKSRFVKPQSGAHNRALDGIRPQAPAGKWLLSALHRVRSEKRGTALAERLSPAWKAEEDENVFALLRTDASELRLFSEKDLLLLADMKADRGNPILGLYDRTARRPVTAEKMMDWEIHAKRKGKALVFSSDDMPCSVGDITDAGFSVRWKGGGIGARASFLLEENGLSADFSVADPDRDTLLRSVVFPVVRCPRYGRNDALLYPYMCGAVVKDPTVNVFARGQDGNYPTATLSMQFSAYFGDGRGMFLGWRDPAGTVKSHQVTGRRGGVEFSWRQSVPRPLAHPAGGNGYASPGKVRLELYSGEWFEAAMIHKKWALSKADWRVPLPRQETPEWYRKVPVVFAMRGYSPKTAQANYAWYKYLRSYLETPALITWMHWFFLDQETWPEYPERPYVRAVFEDMIRTGSYTEPYLDGRLWCTVDHIKNKGNERYEAVGKKIAVKLEDGSIPVEVYGSDAYAVMCPVTEAWQQKLLAMARQIAPFASAFYFDQVTAGAGLGCFDPSHGHALNDPSVWIARGYRPALKRIRQAFPNVPLCSEDAAEAYLDLFDGGHVWRWSFPGLVPAFQAIYGGRMQYYGLLYDKTRGKGSMESNFYKTAASCVNGLKISRTGVEELEPADENRVFFKKMVHLRSALTGYFDAGEMLAPVRFRTPIPERELVFSIPGGTERFAVPLAAVNAYRLGETRVYIFINTSSDPVVLSPQLPESWLCVEGEELPRRFDGQFTLTGRRSAVAVCGPEKEARRLAQTLKKISGFTQGISRKDFDKIK